MMNIETIVVPTDFSKNANAAMPYAVELSRAFGAKIHLVHVFEASLYFTATAADTYAVLAATPAKWLDSKVVENEELLILAGKKFAVDGIDVTTRLLKGNPVKELVKYASEQPHACIVITTHGYTGLAHAVMGSVAERIVRTSLCPVLTVRPTEK
jgi:nucleotide-binding universal stress UspA family protein